MSLIIYSYVAFFNFLILLITNFNLLAFAGNGLSNEDITDELGVVISSKKAIKQIFNTFPKPRPLQKQKKKISSKKRSSSENRKK